MAAQAICDKVSNVQTVFAMKQQFKSVFVEQLDLRRVIDSVLREQLAPLMRLRRIKADVQIDEATAVLARDFCSDQAKVRLLLYNVLHNAVVHAPAKCACL